MQGIASTIHETGTGARIAPAQTVAGTPSAYQGYQILRRNGAVVSFEPSKIAVALMKAFLAVHGTQGAASASVRETVDGLTESVVRALLRSRPAGGTFHIEDIQDQVELGLMRGSHHEVARAYVLYRERRSQDRVKSGQVDVKVAEPELFVTDKGERVPLDVKHLHSLIIAACADLGPDVTAEPVFAETRRNLYDGVPMDEVYKAAILASRTLIEKEPGYTRATARLLMHTIRREILNEEVSQEQMADRYAEYFPKFIKRGIKAELLDEKLGQYDLARLGAALDHSRDMQFDYLGLQTLYDRYFLHDNDERIELPQAFFMRVAMGLSLGEVDREARAIEFYNVLSTFDFMSSTPTLFNAGTRRSQLSSCYLTTVADDLDGIYEALKENALLSKFAGGLGNDWTNVRALGSYIKGTNGKSQGVVPFLKVVNDTAVAVNQGGKRKGAVCAYLETWHLDIEEFLELRKNTGDDRRRTHDMNTANWIPDLFMRRVMEGGDWTLFSPSTCPDLHDLIGLKFEEAYSAYEAKADRGEIKLFKRVPAKDLWRRMLSMLFETGHPWITFKDACNVRSPQQHVGVVHSSNLCTEITLNTSETEIAVCNLGSVNLSQHLVANADGAMGIDHAKLQKTVRTAMRMLDNVIDINYYAVKKARDSNLRHRPVGLGIMGFQDCLYQLRRSLDGGRLLLRVLRVDRTRRRTWPLLVVQGLAVGQGHPAVRLHRPARQAPRRLRRGRSLDHAGLGRAARQDRAARHAQLQLRRDRADRHDLQHHRRGRLDRAVLRQPLGQVQPVGRVHGGQRVPRARPEAPGPVGLRDADGPEALQRLAACRRSRAGRTEGAVCHGVRSRRHVAGGSRCASPEMDRPGAVAQHLSVGRVGQEARRDLQAGVAARPEDHVLPAHDGRDACGEEHRRSQAAQRGAIVARRRAVGDGRDRGAGTSHAQCNTGHGHQVLRRRRPDLRSVPVTFRDTESITRCDA
jgi:ribonucleotide reductase alpha subunit